MGCGERLRSFNASMFSLHVLMNDVECVRVLFDIWDVKAGVRFRMKSLRS